MAAKLTQGVIQSIITRYMPTGWRLKEMPVGGGTSGEADWKKHAITTPALVDLYSLYVFLHEVAHVRLHGRKGPPLYIEEYEASMYSIHQLREMGFRIDRDIRSHARRNTWLHLKKFRDDPERDESIDQRIYKYCDPKSPARDKARYERRKKNAW